VRLNPVPTPPKRPRDCITCSPRGVRRLCAGAQARRGCSDVDPCQRRVVGARRGLTTGSARLRVRLGRAFRRSTPDSVHQLRTASVLVEGIGAAPATTAGTPAPPWGSAVASRPHLLQTISIGPTHGEGMERALCAPQYYAKARARQLWAATRAARGASHQLGQVG